MEREGEREVGKEGKMEGGREVGRMHSLFGYGSQYVVCSRRVSRYS